VRAVSLHVTGVVQGVGFRPFVYSLACRLGVCGWVKNTGDGVFCLAEGTEKSVDAFIHAIRAEAPPMAVVESVTAEDVDLEGFCEFVIVPSEAVEGAMTLVSPDIATCDACSAEIFDPADRRHRYPFTNCTNCGPRFTIIDDVPYDRPLTSMRAFPMCAECAAEYGDPADRRFHAQPNACFRCGPRLYLNVVGGAEGSGAQTVLAGRPDGNAPTRPAAELAAAASPPPSAGVEWRSQAEATPRLHREPEAERKRSDAILAEAVRLLHEGAILAVKSLGGFQLACDATSELAVARLRERKNRWGKPLAIMVPDLTTARAYCEISEAEEELLTSPSAPIVLLAMRGCAGPLPAPPLAPSLAPALHELGVMLPYTPLHHLLLAAFGGTLVMTSGNRSEEPIATDNAEALVRLADIADAFLLHDRDIRSRYDDSVMRVGVGIEPLRRARGYAPFPLRLPFDSDVDILAVGPEQKNTFCLVRGSHAFVSQHIGDLENAETLASFEDTLAQYERLFRVRPELVAYDLHPEYLSTKLAHSLGLPSVGVQHHHAHIAGVAAEHGVSTPVIGVAFDGTGYGSDGTIWGGEILLATWEGFERVGHLSLLPLPGGAAAVRRPARMALGALAACGLLEHPGANALRERLTEGEEDTVLTMIERSINTPLTSSAGRLFDAVAALVGVRDDARYEGQAAIELEALADASAEGAYRFGIEPGHPLVIDPAPVLAEVLDDLAAGTPAPTISMRFHRAVVAAMVDGCALVAEATGVRRVALAGGVFANRLVLGGATRELERSGYTTLTHVRLPANDGGVSFGQAVVAWARRHEA
jgi:hydrogenase maturation protein HypF